MEVVDCSTGEKLCLEVMAVALAVINVGENLAILEKTFFTVRINLGARPIYARATGELLISHGRIIAVSSFRHPFPLVENFLSGRPRHHRRVIFVSKIHPLSKIEDDHKIRSCLSWWVNGFAGGV